MIAELLERDAEALDEESRQRRIASQAAQTAPSSTSTSGDQERLAKIEADYISQMAELRLELRQAKQTEEHLRDDRNNCRQTAWCLQSNSQQGDDGDEQKEGEEEEIPPSESLTDLGPGGGGGGGGDDDDDTPSRRYGHLCGDPSGPPPDAPDDDGEPEVMEVKISRREADKVVVPPFPRVTHLDSWMSHCIANVLSACADPNHKCWISLLQPNPDIEGTNESGHLKFKSIDVKFGVAMTAMLKSTGDNASDLYLGVNRKANHAAYKWQVHHRKADHRGDVRKLGHDRYAGISHQDSVSTGREDEHVQTNVVRSDIRSDWSHAT